VTSRVPLARHPVAIAGALIATAASVAFIALAIAAAFDLFENPYAGLVIFVALPAVFLLGLLLIPAGMWLERRKRRRHPGEMPEWPVLDFGKPQVRRAALIVTALTAVNVVIILVAGYGGLHAMDSPTFCGQACHTPMRPQFTAWQQAIHSRVACSACHIGEGARAMVHYKLAGVRQLYHVITDHYPRPIPSEADMRPALQVCGHCHEPGRPAPERTRVFREYADDESNSETKTVLQMHVGGGGGAGTAAHAIHWHADPAVRIEYLATDRQRQTISYVKVTDRQGQVKEYTAQDATPQQLSQGVRRIMDCVDCHNTIGHRILPTPEKAVDRAIAAGRIDRRLPFVRREGVRVLKQAYPGDDVALAAIDRSLREFYRGRGGAIDERALARGIQALQDVYRHNVFPTMKVTWGTYADNIGHLTSNGCFRCHDGSHTAKDGSTISSDCEYCHTDTTPAS
jgi:nitrate/TMAO reductase-like tetraheme cytochrome c subunit